MVTVQHQSKMTKYLILEAFALNLIYTNQRTTKNYRKTIISMINNEDKVSCVYIFCLTKLVIFPPIILTLTKKRQCGMNLMWIRSFFYFTW